MILTEIMVFRFQLHHSGLWCSCYQLRPRFFCCGSLSLSFRLQTSHVITFKVLYLLLAKPFITTTSLASSTIKKCCTPCFWHEEFQLLWVVIISLVKLKLIEDVCCCHGYFCLDNFVLSDLCFDKLHILLVFHIYQEDFWHGVLKNV